jgi:hypothetical protein
MTGLTLFGPAVVGDFLGFGGDGFPADAEVVFQSPEGQVIDRLPPDLVRPHWLLLKSLPPAIPVGESQVFVEGSQGWATPPMSLRVSPAGPNPVRVLYPGRPVEWPFTIAFVANPAIRTARGEIIPDPVLTRLPRFAATVTASLRTLLALDEDLLRRGGLERLIRFVVVLDPAAPPTEDNALAQEYGQAPVMCPRRRPAAEFLRRYGVAADVVFVIHGSRTHRLASAQYTTDDPARERLEYTYDGVRRVHGLFAAVPGGAALSIDLSHGWPIALHEFAHAVSECQTGQVIDAYVEKGDYPDTIVNKKYRKRKGQRVPKRFGTYGVGDRPPQEYASDPDRDGLGYPKAWTSYHPAPLEPSEPNLMDDYRQAQIDPLKCRFDRLTYQWLWDRLWAKANR